jgi:xanthine dehydrogenase accessory factor
MDIFQQIVEKRASGEPFVIATVVKTLGSSPREAGARMLVFADGTISGTIGGGTFEKLVIDDCMKLFGDDNYHILKRYSFTENGPDATGMHCGGEAEVFIELNTRPARLLIFGGGHIGRDLARLAVGIGFRITIIDERPEILREYRSPIETILTDADYNDNFPIIDKNSYIVIVTHGHKCDNAVLKKVIDKDCAYIGMIGSNAKIKTMFGELEQAGVTKEKLARIHAPIGLQINAEGPYEIAIAIAAELIAVKKSGKPL